MNSAPSRPLTFPDFTLVSASAGSGKTYALALRYISVLLRRDAPANDLPQLLAITFTHNAAAEMRHRILFMLKQLSVQEPGAPLSDVMVSTGLPAPEIRKRAGEAVMTILDRYADFHVRTIDSFVARMAKASALDLGIPPDFELLLDQRRVTEHAFDLFAETLLPHHPETEEMLRLAGDISARRGGNARVVWDPFSTVRDGVGALLDRLAPSMKRLEQTVSAADVRRHQEHLESIAAQLLRLAAEWDVPLTKYFEADLNLIAGGDWREAAHHSSKAAKFTKKGTKAQEASIAEHKELLQNTVGQLYAALGDLVESAARFDARPFADAIAGMGRFLKRARESSGGFGFEDITRLLVDYLNTGAVPEVYLMLGELLSHYLLDEFQDTSPLQWAAFRPLLENALASGGGLFVVGDTRQSIFGFRGADWRIMRGLADGSEGFASVPVRQVSLATNRRSDQAIVDFVASTFEAIHAQGGADDEAIVQSDLHLCRQEPLAEKKGKGHVEVLRIDTRADSDADRTTVLDLVRDARSRGYAWGDIAILTPGNEGVINAGAWLNQEGIPFVSHSTLDIRSRKVVGELLALLRFLDAPVDSLAFATFLMGNLFSLVLENAGVPGVTHNLYAELVRLPLSSGPPLYRRFRQNQPQLWDTFFAPLFTGVGHLPVYDLLATVCKTFDVYTLCPGEEGALLKLLEVAKDFEQEGDNSLKEFLARAADPSGEDEAAWTLTPPSGAAVTLMTIHKAKGMQFPLVIVLYYDFLPGVAGPLVDDRGETVELVRVTRTDAQWSPRLGELYQRASRDNLTDQFNRLYVALTRAQNEMYVVSAGDSEQPMRFPGRVLSPPPAGPRPQKGAGGAVRQPPVQPLVPLHVLERAPATVAEHAHIGYRATRRGNQLHAVLARIGTVPDPAALEIPGDASIPPEDWPGVRKAIASFLAAPDVAPLFADRPGRISMNERECVSRDGNLLRVDRLVIDPDSVTIIDFKSGETEDREKYDRQVGQYMEVMRDLYPGRRISGAIAYVDVCLVRRIG